MYRIACEISNLGVKNRFCKEEDKDIIRYGIEVVLSQILIFMPIISYSFYSDNTWGILSMVILFSFLRINSNGYHVKTFMGCFILTNIILFATIYLTSILKEYSILEYSISILFLLWLCVSLLKVNNRKFNLFSKTILFILVIVVLFKIMNINFLNISLMRNIAIVAYILSNNT